MTPDRKVRVTSATINAIVLLRDVAKEIFDALAKESGIVIWSLRSTILLYFVGIICEIYSGNKFIALKINRDMVNKKFGEFSLSKRTGQIIHYLNAKKKKKKIKGVKIIKKVKSQKVSGKKKKKINGSFNKSCRFSFRYV